MMPVVTFSGKSVALGPLSKLYAFSDGVYEVHKTDGSMIQGELVDYMARPPGPDDHDEVWRFIRRAAGPDGLVDDYSLREVVFN